MDTGFPLSFVAILLNALHMPASLACADKISGTRTLGQGEMMTEATAPPFTGLHHFAFSAAWYQKVFQVNPVDGCCRTTGASGPGTRGWSSSPAPAPPERPGESAVRMANGKHLLRCSAHKMTAEDICPRGLQETAGNRARLKRPQAGNHKENRTGHETAVYHQLTYP